MGTITTLNGGLDPKLHPADARGFSMLLEASIHPLGTQEALTIVEQIARIPGFSGRIALSHSLVSIRWETRSDIPPEAVIAFLRLCGKEIPERP